MSNLIVIVSEPDTDSDVIRNPGTSLWIVKGRLYIQRRLNVQGEYAMEESHRTFNVVASTPAGAVETFLRNVSRHCGPLQIVASIQVDSVKWSDWVDAGAKV